MTFGAPAEAGLVDGTRGAGSSGPEHGVAAKADPVFVGALRSSVKLQFGEARDVPFSGMKHGG